MDKTSPEGRLESTMKKLPIKREDRNQKQKKKGLYRATLPVHVFLLRLVYRSVLKNFPDMFKALISIPGIEEEKRRGRDIGMRKGKEKGVLPFESHIYYQLKIWTPYSIYSTGLHQKIQTAHKSPHILLRKSLTLTRGHRMRPRNT